MSPPPGSGLKRKVPWWVWLPTVLGLSYGVLYLRFSVFPTASEASHAMMRHWMDSSNATARHMDSLLKTVTPPKQRELMARMDRLCRAMRVAGNDSASLDLADFSESSGLAENWVGHVYMSGANPYLMNSPVDYRPDTIGDSLRHVAQALDRRLARFSARLLSTGDVDACLPAFPIRLVSLAPLNLPGDTAAHAAAHP